LVTSADRSLRADPGRSGVDSDGRRDWGFWVGEISPRGRGAGVYLYRWTETRPRAASSETEEAPLRRWPRLADGPDRVPGRRSTARPRGLSGGVEVAESSPLPPLAAVCVMIFPFFFLGW
jgi:hypothetical protein